MDALTGKSNFDISEWMLLHLLQKLESKSATLAMLCKTAVARKVLVQAWKQNLPIISAEIRRIDALTHFGAAVDACLFICAIGTGERCRDCLVFDELDQTKADSSFGWRDRQLVSDVENYERTKHLEGQSPFRWRSGIKHDCSRVMELVRDGDGFRNGLDEAVAIESDCLYPMLKSSEVARGAVDPPKRWMLVTQSCIGENTARLKASAPLTWRYLVGHSELLDKRASSIYRDKPPFSIFGVGDYAFAPWKVAISGLYKKLEFVKLGTFEGKPIVVDDTVYFLPCQTETQADLLLRLLASPMARRFYESRIFWDSKRPITAAILSSLDPVALSVGLEVEAAPLKPPRTQKQLFA